jgi:hypothetical protein
VESCVIRIIFVRSEDSKSDWFMKNVSSDLYNHHKGSFIISKGEVDTIVNFERRVLVGE